MRDIGKRGLDKRWAERYQIIEELKQYFDTDHVEKLKAWPTKYLKSIRDYEKNGRWTK